jgi:hypothetical protein
MKKILFIIFSIFPLFVWAQSNQSNLIRVNIQKDTKPAILQWVEGSVEFIDPSGNNIVDADEECFIRFSVKNTGMADAYNCIAKIETIGAAVGINCKNVSVPKIAMGETCTVDLPISASHNTQDGQVSFRISMYEPMGFGTSTKELVVTTHHFQAPMLRIVDHIVAGTSSNKLKKSELFNLQILLQNVEHGLAEYVDVIVTFPEKEGVYLVSGEKERNFRQIGAGKTEYLEYSMIIKEEYASNEIPIRIEILEKYGKYAENSTVTLHLNQEIDANGPIVVGPTRTRTDDGDIEIGRLKSIVDTDIPHTNQSNNNTFAVIIANENYRNEAKVPYALNDGDIFRKYCQHTLGIPEKHIHYVPDATLNGLKAEINWLKDVLYAHEGEAKVIFYYAGHGVPNESNQSAYLLPVDGFGSDITTGYLLDDLYQTLGNAPSAGTILFLDACFSGAKREGDMMVAARAVAIKVKKNVPIGSMVVFAAAQSDETAYQHDEEKHGMFTYYLLEKLQETKGDVTLEELGDHIITEVRKSSVTLNRKSQTPSVIPSASLMDNWKNWKLK